MTTTQAGPVHAASSAPGPAAAARGRRPLGRRLTPYLFVAVPVVLLLTFTYVPMANLLWFSVTDWDGLSPVQEFVGTDNYVEIGSRPALFRVFVVSAYYLAASVIQLGLALFFATVLSFDLRFRNLFKGILFFPYLVNAVAIGMIFLYFFRPGGTLDGLLGAVGLEAWQQQWLGNRDIANWSLAGTSVWRYMGLNFVLFLGAIASIPGQLYEAAEIDGATRWQQFRFIILPGIRPVVGISMILAVSGSLSVFEIPFIMTGGANGTETFVIQTLKLAFESYKVGLASALAVVLLLLVLLVTWIQRRLLPDEEATLT